MPERFLLLDIDDETDEIGLASQNHLYARQRSPLDGSGRPVPTASLIPLRARFATIPAADPTNEFASRIALLEPGPWREDVLDPSSPVPRLEVHLARQLQLERRTPSSKEPE